MSISIKKYVDITSGVGGAGSVRQRDLIGRLFTDNPRVPVGSIIEITSAADALAYFGASSNAYARALFYFSFVSKLIVAPQKLSYARWADVASAPRIYGSKAGTSLATFQAVTAGTLSVTLGANTNAFTGVSFAAATSFADVAAALQTKIRTGTGTQFAAATVTYDAVAGTFNLTGSVAGAAPVSVTIGTGADLALALGWGPLAVFSPGADVTSLSATLTASADASNNFGSFAFMEVLTNTQAIEVATWNAARNVDFMYCLPVNDTNMVALSAALIGFAGVAMTYTPSSVVGQYDEMCPMIVMAATDYTKRNSVQNYMFQQFPTLTAKVSDTTISNTLDALRVNYNGNTQTAGQQINFYQRGIMGGGSTALVDMNIYANELWLKDAAASNILSLLLSLAKISANVEGISQILAILQDAIDRALFNGTISVGKTLTTVQKLYISQMTGDDLAWHQVQGVGYWVTCVMQSYVTTDGRTEYKAVYTLIYSKDDDIRKVEGTHVLI